MGVEVGPGSRVVPVDPAHAYTLVAVAQSFLPARWVAEGSALAGARVGLVLRPEGFGEARPLDLDDGTGLAMAAALLVRRGRHQQAMQYAERVVEVSPEVALGHRALGDAAYAPATGSGPSTRTTLTSPPRRRRATAGPSRHGWRSCAGISYPGVEP